MAHEDLVSCVAKMGVRLASIENDIRDIKDSVEYMRRQRMSGMSAIVMALGAAILGLVSYIWTKFH